jgi:transposase
MATAHGESHLHIGIAPKSALARLLLQKKSRVAAERNPDKRAAFQHTIEQVDPKNLVFLDEAGFSLALPLLYGWGPTTERLFEAVPAQRGVNLSVLGAFDLEGMVSITHKEGPMKRVDVEAFLRQDLLPRLLPGSVLVLDNARIHHGGEIEKVVSEAGCSLLYLPPYSPDFSPIELAWGWLKRFVRRLCPRDALSRLASLEEAVASLPAAFAPSWFRKCGYSLC